MVAGALLAHRLTANDRFIPLGAIGQQAILFFVLITPTIKDKSDYKKKYDPIH
jgi:hypothetical protein